MRFIDKTGKEPNYLLTHRRESKTKNYDSFCNQIIGNRVIINGDKKDIKKKKAIGNIEGEEKDHYGIRKDIAYQQGHLCCFCMCTIPQYPYTNNDINSRFADFKKR